MAISDPVSKTGIVNRFEDLVTDVANASIVWGTDSKPFTEMPDGNYAGTTSGTTIGVTGASITDTIITASTIRTILETEAALYTNIRQQRAVLFVTGGGGNTGSRPTPGIVFDDTQVAHLDTGNRDVLGAISDADVTSGETISDTNLETYFGNIATAYNTVRTTTITDQVDVCHASCHSSCHGSRGRR
jgi:hypothetical protein